MNAQQIAIVQETWQQALPIQAQAAQLFYTRLFELDPSVRTLFKEDMATQGLKLMAMINVAVRGLNRLDTLVPAVQELGRRHSAYGVTDEHYATVGAALLWTLRQGLGQTFTPEAEEAWRTTYGVLSSTMRQAAVRETAPAQCDALIGGA